MSFQDQKSYCSKAEAEIQKEKGRKGTALMRQVPYQGCVCICKCVFVDVCGVNWAMLRIRSGPTYLGFPEKTKALNQACFL